MKRRSLRLVALLVLLWLATALRFYRLDAQSFWNDEGNSARLSERSVALIVEGAAADIHPPLYYLMLGGWRGLLGQSEFALRAFSAFSGILLVAATLRLAGHLLQHKALAPFLAALLVAVNPALIYYSQEARMYELLGLCTILSTLFLWRLLPLLADPDRRRRGPGRAFILLGGAYLLATVAGLYTHYFFGAVLLAHNLLLAWHLLARRVRTPLARSGQILGRWALIMGLVFLAYLPWLPIFLRQAGGRAGDSVSMRAFLAAVPRWLVLGPTVESTELWWATAAAGVLALLGLLPRRPQKQSRTAAHHQSPQPTRVGPNLPSRPGSAPISPADQGRPQSPLPTLLILLALPLLLMLLLGATRPVFYKFMVVSVPFLALLQARGVVVGRRLLSGSEFWPRAGQLLALLAVVAVVAGAAGSLANLYYDPAFARADYRRISARIAAEEHPNAAIILNAANQWEVFTYYHREGAPVYPIPRGQPDAERIAAELEQITDRHDRLYALYWGEAERDPQRRVERWLDSHAFKAEEEWVGDVRFVTYAVPEEPATTIEEEAGVRFGSSITLEGYTLQEEELAAGDILQVTLFWRAQDALQTRYKVFLHLVDDGGQLVAQRDAEPGGNLTLTTTWQPDQLVVDNHGLLLPPAAEPGHYTLRVGLYPLGDPAARLPVQEVRVRNDSGDLDSGQADPAASDFYPLSRITVR